MTRDEIIKGLRNLADEWGDEGLLGDMTAMEFVTSAADLLEASEKRVKELEEVVQMCVDSQEWDGNNPDDERWTEFYSQARAALEEAGE